MEVTTPQIFIAHADQYEQCRLSPGGGPVQDSRDDELPRRDAGFLKAVAGSYAQVGAVPAMMEVCDKAAGAAVQRREPSVDGGWTAH